MIVKWFRQNTSIEIITAYVKKFANSNLFAKIIIGVVIWVVCLIPFWLYLLTMWILSPITFWHGFAVTFLFIFALGWLQGLFMFFAVVLTGFLISEDNF